MSEQPNPDIEMIDAYLDGRLSTEARAEFERRMSADAGLRAEIELQRRIDDRLRILMSPPQMPKEAAAPSSEAAPMPIRLPVPAVPLRAIPAWAKAAAVLVLGAIGAWAVIERPWQAWSRPPEATLTANAVMKRMLVDEGFTPAWVCDTDEKFLAYTKEKLHISFLVRPAAGVELVGWTYTAGLLSDPAQVLLVRANGEPVIVAMGAKDTDRVVHADPGSGLNVRREVHRGVVMYEISKLDHAVVLDSIVDK